MESAVAEIEVQKYEAYKESGIEWIKKIPSHWRISRLGALLSGISEKNRPDLPLLSITRAKGVITRDLDDEDENHNFIPDDLSGYKVLKEGQLGMNKMKAWQGSYGVAKATGIVSPAYYVFDFSSTINPAFFHVALRSKIYVSFFAAASDGVRIGQWDLSKSRMKEIPFLLPPVEEQTAIANFLDRKTAQIDQAIAQKERLIKLLQERRQILIQRAVTCGLNPDASMKDSGVEWIGKIPAHWEVKRVKHMSNFITSGPRGWSEFFSNHGAYFLQSGDLNETLGIELEYAVRVNPKPSAEGVRTRLKEGDVLVVITGAKTGKVAIANIESNEVYINQHLCLIRPTTNIKSDFLALSLYSPIGRTYFYLQQYGLKEGLGLQDIKDAPVICPPVEEQIEIVARIDTISAGTEEAVALKKKEIRKLREYKSTLINAAVTGKIKVC